MGTNAEKRARQKANREAAAPPAPTQGRTYLIAGLIALVALVGLAVWQFAGDDDTAEKREAPEESADDAGTETTTSSATSTPCPPVERSEERRSTFDGPPEMCIDPAKSYSATIDTTAGAFTMTLDAKSAPETVNNFVVLARYGYYDGVPFHRVVPGFVIQAGDGDGTADGSNDLGYTIPDELPDSADAYVDYSVAMANRGPGTNGSQFFVVLPGGGSRLTPSYSLFGQVIEGAEVVDAIGALGGSDGKPTEEVLINSVTITES
ncbi:MAG: peptidylprolyl isomerase [Microthrixaceae bacterium]|nr:peptidylprolyl isomerase [Microthrixaceae bacterium]